MKHSDTILVFTAVLLMLFGCTVAAETPQRTVTRHNGLGVVISADNPYMYNMGLPVGGKLLTDENFVYTNIDFSPAYTSVLNTESILFCGNFAEDFNNHAGKVVVLTYERTAHQAFHGRACHTLRSIVDVGVPVTEGQ